MSYLFPNDEDSFLYYQQGIPTEYSFFACDDTADNLYAVGPSDSLFKLDSYEAVIYIKEGRPPFSIWIVIFQRQAFGRKKEIFERYSELVVGFKLINFGVF